MRPATALRYLERLAAKLPESSESSREAESEEETPAARPVVPVKAATPAPIRPVRKPAPTATGLSDDLPIEEWMKRRNAHLRKK
jgi:hypothetical protein